MIGAVGGVARVGAVEPVPRRHQLYAAATGAGEVVVVDDRTLAEVGRTGGLRAPRGLADVPGVDRVFVADTRRHDGALVDAGTHRVRATVPLGGPAGDVRYDAGSGCLLVAVRAPAGLAAVDPARGRVVARYALPGVEAPDGLVVDGDRRLAFVTGAGNATVAVVDLRTARVVQRLRVADGPDATAWDPVWRRLYVATEAGVLSSFWAAGDTLLPIGDEAVPGGRVVAVDPRTHRVYVPLERVDGRPVLRVYVPALPAGSRAVPGRPAPELRTPRR